MDGSTGVGTRKECHPALAFEAENERPLADGNVVLHDLIESFERGGWRPIEADDAARSREIAPRQIQTDLEQIGHVYRVRLECGTSHLIATSDDQPKSTFRVERLKSASPRAPIIGQPAVRWLSGRKRRFANSPARHDSA